MSKVDPMLTAEEKAACYERLEMQAKHIQHNLSLLQGYLDVALAIEADKINWAQIMQAAWGAQDIADHLSELLDEYAYIPNEKAAAIQGFINEVAKELEEDGILRS